MKNLIEVVQNLKDEYTNGIYFVKEDYSKFVLYHDVYVNILKMSNLIHENKIFKGDNLIFQIKNKEIFIYAFWACIVNGIHVIPLEFADSQENLNKLIHVCDSLSCKCTIITDEFTTINRGICDVVSVIDISGYSVNMELKRFVKIEDENAIAMIQYSSGSTGDPKGIMLSHKNIVSNVQAILDGICANKEDRALSWLPLSHGMGLIGFHISPVYYKATHIIVDTHVFMKNPISWLENIEKYKASLTAAPDFALKHLINYINILGKQINVDLSSMRLILNGAESISYDTIMEFYKLTKTMKLSDESMFPVYGLTEGTLAVAFPKLNSQIKFIDIDMRRAQIAKKIHVVKGGVRIVSVGSAVNGVNISVKDEVGRELSDGYIGRIYICGENVSEYSLVNGKVEQGCDEKNWRFTGDLGFFFEGFLYIIGRESEIVINGKNYFLNDAQQVVDGILSTNNLDTRMFLLPVLEQGYAHVLLFVGSTYNVEIIKIFKSIKIICINKLGINIEGLVFIENIPLTNSGKVKKYEVINNYLDGIYGSKITVSERDTYESLNNQEQIVIDLFENIYGIRPSRSQDLREIASESLNFYLFCCSLNDFFKTNIRIEDMWKCTNVNDIVQLIRQYN